jgi:hypothetical protein
MEALQVGLVVDQLVQSEHKEHLNLWIDKIAQFSVLQAGLEQATLMLI